MSTPSSPTNKTMAAVVGDRVSVGATALVGTVRFLGTTDFASGEWMGVELDEPVGKNDGTVKGKVYFECKNLHGLFVRPTAVVKEEDLKAAPTAASAPASAAKEARSSVAASATPAPAPTAEIKRQSGLSAAGAQAASKPPASPTSPVSNSSPAITSFDAKPQNLASVQLQLAEAMEDHDLEKIKHVLPMATKMGVPEVELEAAKRILSFEWSHLLLGEIESMRGSVSKLTKSVVEAESHASVTPSGGGNRAAWLEKLGGELEKRIWKKLEKKIDTIVDSAVSKASVELMAASQEVQELTKYLKSNGMKVDSYDQLKKQNSDSKLAAARFSVMNILSNVAEKESEKQQKPELVRKSISMIMSGAIARANSDGSQKQTEELAEKALSDAAEIRGSMARIERAKTQAKLKMDDSATKVQAAARGRAARKDQEKKGAAAAILQRGMRRWRSFRKANPGSDIATIAIIIRQRHKDWAIEYDDAAGELGRLETGPFVTALRNIFQSKVSDKQAAALWTGYEEMSREGGPMDLQTFCAIAEAVAQGEQVAAEFADIPVEDYAALADGDVKTKARSILVNGLKDGSLDKAVTELAEGKENKEGEVKSKAKNALLSGLKDGSLDQAITDIMQDKSDVKSKAKDALLVGLKDGSLDRAIDEALQGKGGDVRAKAKSLLLTGLQDGSLDRAISEVQVGAAELDQVKDRTKNALVAGLQDGSLNKAITEILEQGGDLNTVREKAKSALLTGLKDGSLEKAVDELAVSNPDQVKLKARGLLLNSLKDGSLEKAVSSMGAEGQQSGNDAEKVRQKARGMLLSGLKDGSLEKAVSTIEEESPQDAAEKASKDPQKSVVQQKARGLLLSGLKDGSLEKVVSTMETESNDSAQQKAATTMQRAVRRHLLNKSAADQDFFRAAMIMKQKYKAYYSIFQSWVKKQEKTLADSQHLGETAFCGAVREANLSTSERQAKALFKGICEGTGATSVELKIYCQVSQAVKAGDDLAADFCDMDVEDYLKLADPA